MTARAGESLVCAHRGASAGLPDNSRTAFLAAIVMGADMLEADVRRDATGRLVLAHDPLPERPQPDLMGLDELVRVAEGRVGLDLELKEEGLERDVLEAVGARSAGVLLTSFLPRALEAVRALDDGVETGLVVGAGDGGGDLFARAAACGARTLVAHVSLVDTALLRQARRAARPLLVWTVNDPGRLAELAREPAVSGVITDVPDVACEARARAAARGRRAA